MVLFSILLRSAAKMNCFPSAVAENQISQEVEAINYKFP